VVAGKSSDVGNGGLHELGAQFVTHAPDYSVGAVLGRTIAGQRQHELVGDQRSKATEPYAAA
jgi:hypothetical protein